MASSLITGGAPTNITRGSVDAQATDLPGADWPALSRIAAIDLVGPLASNRQQIALQKRTAVIGDRIDSLLTIVRGMTGIVGVAGNYGRMAHAPSLVSLFTISNDDDRDYFLPRDGSLVMWGRLALGSPRSHLHAAAFDNNAYGGYAPASAAAAVGYHWWQGPSTSGAGDNDLVYGIRRIGISNYEMYVSTGGSQYKVLSTYDLLGGGLLYTGLMQVSLSNNRVITVGNADLGVERSGASISNYAQLTIRTTQPTAPADDNWRLRVTCATLLTDRGLSVRHDQYGEFVNLLGGTVGRPRMITVAAFAVFSNYQTGYVSGAVPSTITYSTLALTTESPALSNTSYQDAPLTVSNTSSKARIGFANGASGSALYFDSLSSGMALMRTRSSTGVDRRLAYIEEVSAPTNKQTFTAIAGPQTWTNTTGGTVLLHVLLRGGGGGIGGEDPTYSPPGPGAGAAGATGIYRFLVDNGVSVTITVGGAGSPGIWDTGDQTSGGGGGSGTRLVHGADTYIAGGGGGGGASGNSGGGGGNGGVAGTADGSQAGGAAGTNAITNNGGTGGSGAGASNSPAATNGTPGTYTAGYVAMEYLFNSSETDSGQGVSGLCVLRW